MCFIWYYNIIVLYVLCTRPALAAAHGMWCTAAMTTTASSVTGSLNGVSAG